MKGSARPRDFVFVELQFLEDCGFSPVWLVDSEWEYRRKGNGLIQDGGFARVEQGQCKEW